MKISALVVTFNEEKRLRECLQSILFCDQIVVVDLGSKDKSAEIAKEFATDFMVHELVQFGEEVWPELFPFLKYDWILRMDPDEIFSEGLIESVRETISSTESNAGIITVPYQYYFLGRPLNYTIWGGIRNLPKIMNRKRINLHPRVHNGCSLKNGYSTLDITSGAKNAVKHYWVDNYQQLFSKHFRYIKAEGKSRYERGERISLLSFIKQPFRACLYSFLRCKGWQGGGTGIFLSVFYGWYVLMSLFSLGVYQLLVNSEEK